MLHSTCGMFLGAQVVPIMATPGARIGMEFLEGDVKM